MAGFLLSVFQIQLPIAAHFDDPLLFAFPDERRIDFEVPVCLVFKYIDESLDQVVVRLRAVKRIERHSRDIHAHKNTIFIFGQFLIDRMDARMVRLVSDVFDRDALGLEDVKYGFYDALPEKFTVVFGRRIYRTAYLNGQC